MCALSLQPHARSHYSFELRASDFSLSVFAQQSASGQHYGVSLYYTNHQAPFDIFEEVFSLFNEDPPHRSHVLLVSHLVCILFLLIYYGIIEGS
jgi:hypothetical protein